MRFSLPLICQWLLCPILGIICERSPRELKIQQLEKNDTRLRNQCLSAELDQDHML